MRHSPIGETHDEVVREEIERNPAFASVYEETRFEGQLALELAAMRESRHLTQSALARIVGTSQPMINRLERAGQTPTVTTLWWLMRALDATAEISPTTITIRPTEAVAGLSAWQDEFALNSSRWHVGGNAMQDFNVTGTLTGPISTMAGHNINLPTSLNREPGQIIAEYLARHIYGGPSVGTNQSQVRTPPPAVNSYISAVPAQQKNIATQSAGADQERAA